MWPPTPHLRFLSWGESATGREECDADTHASNCCGEERPQIAGRRFLRRLPFQNHRRRSRRGKSGRHRHDRRLWQDDARRPHDHRFRKVEHACWRDCRSRHEGLPRRRLSRAKSRGLVSMRLGSPRRARRHRAYFSPRCPPVLQSREDVERGQAGRSPQKPGRAEALSAEGDAHHARLRRPAQGGA
jgi:hypothetical protein